MRARCNNNTEHLFARRASGLMPYYCFWTRRCHLPQHIIFFLSTRYITTCCSFLDIIAALDRALDRILLTSVVAPAITPMPKCCWRKSMQVAETPAGIFISWRAGAFCGRRFLREQGKVSVPPEKMIRAACVGRYFSALQQRGARARRPPRSYSEMAGT